MHLKRLGSGAVTTVTILAFVASGCSRTVSVPLQELAPASHWDGRYHIDTTAGRFSTLKFSVTDDEIVITKLAKSDKRYGRADLPLTSPMQDVRSIERLETDGMKTTLGVVGGLVAFLGAMVAIIALQEFN